MAPMTSKVKTVVPRKTTPEVLLATVHYTRDMSVQALPDLVEYQTAAVVSRVILKNPGGTVTAFAFDAGEGLSEHTAPFDALIQVTEGEASVTIAGDVQAVSAGQLLTLPAKIPHAVKAVTKFKMLLVMIKGEKL